MRNTSPRRRSSSLHGKNFDSMTPAELREVKARRDRMSGLTPVPEGKGLCPQCGAHVPLRQDGALRSHRFAGFPCPGAKPYVVEHDDRQVPCIYCGVPIKGNEKSIRMHIKRDPLCPGNWLED